MILSAMSTLAEIEAAVVQLMPSQQKELYASPGQHLETRLEACLKHNQ